MEIKKKKQRRNCFWKKYIFLLTIQRLKKDSNSVFYIMFLKYRLLKDITCAFISLKPLNNSNISVGILLLESYFPFIKTQINTERINSRYFSKYVINWYFTGVYCVGGLRKLITFEYVARNLIINIFVDFHLCMCSLN